MFAQLFGAAKRAISRTPSYQGRSSEAAEEVPEVFTSDPAPHDTDIADAVTMVTTRRGTETPGMAGTPASSAKKIGKRELEALETPTQVKRQRKTTVEVKRNLRSTPRKGGDAPSAESTQEDGEEDTNESKTSPLAIRRRSSPKVVVEPSSPAPEDAPQDGFHTPEPASSEAAFVTPFTSKKALAGSPTPKASQTETPAAAKKARGRPKKTQKDELPEEIPTSTQESSDASPAVVAAPAAGAPKAHVRFGSEEPTSNLKGHTRYEAPTPPAAAAAPVDNEENDDSGSDSDEAPEMVSTSAAASKAAAVQADTSRALAAQTEKERKKREAREQRIAAEQAAKREREALKAKKVAARAAKAARLSSVAELDEAAEDEDEDDEEATPMDTDRTSLPSLLPDSLLANLSATRPPTPPPEARGKTSEQLRQEKLNHHIKFLEQSSKAPKDKRVGKHHVAVLGQRSGVLPAKVSRGTKGVREAWLKGRKGQEVKGKPRVGKTQRAKFGGGGFLRGED